MGFKYDHRFETEFWGNLEGKGANWGNPVSGLGGWGCCFDLAAMDELRVQAYLALIQALLDCPGGEENEILNGHQELLDEGFVQVRQQGES